VKGFQISGADEKFVWANAQMDADSVLVSSDKVSKPVAVRYGWADNPEVNLYNADKMPVVPFRTDDWHSANPAPPKK
jgi:sialate O-acetylesterase